MQCIRKPSHAVELEALRNNVKAVKYIQNEELQIETVIRNPNAIKYIQNPSEDVQLSAVQINPHVIKHIKKPSAMTLATAERIAPEVQTYAVSRQKEQTQSFVPEEKQEQELGFSR